MELTGQHRIPAPRQAVWDALNDPELLKECITGCQRLEKIDDRNMTATVQAKVGPVKATFNATVEIVDPEPPVRYTLVGEGKGGVAGFAKGSADVALTEDGAETILDYTARATVGGKLAQLGSRLVDTTAKKYAADFFTCFVEKMAERSGTAPAATEAAAPAAAAAAPAATAAGVAATAGSGTAATADDDGPLSSEIIEEGLDEAEIAYQSPPIDSPHLEDTIEEELEEAAARFSWGGAVMWGMLAFAVVILVLIALQ